MKHKKKRKGVVNYAPRCPYCGSTTVYRSATGIYKENPNDVMLYVCTNYPNCDAYVQTQKGTPIPLGEMANGELRALRNEAHRHFNKLYLQKYMTKQDAYRWLSCVLGVPLEKAHIVVGQLILGSEINAVDRQGLEQDVRRQQRQALRHGAGGLGKLRELIDQVIHTLLFRQVEIDLAAGSSSLV